MCENIKKKILIINCGIHEKNRQGLTKILHHLQAQNQTHIEKYKFGSIADIPHYDIIYSPSQAINTALYPNQKFIFGPHFSTFPDVKQLHTFQAHKYKNSIYIQPSEWVVQLWKNMDAEQCLPVRPFAFPVDTDKFTPLLAAAERNSVFLYYKHRDPNELKMVIDFLSQRHINYRLFDYNQRYNEADYLAYLQQCKYGIILDAHESQGFAIEEALSCDVPLLVWNAQTMNQEYNSHYQPIPCTSIPYWDNRCGEFFHRPEELAVAFQTFQTKLNNSPQQYSPRQYSPRQYILENLSTEKCAAAFNELV